MVLLKITVALLLYYDAYSSVIILFTRIHHLLEWFVWVYQYQQFINCFFYQWLILLNTKSYIPGWFAFNEQQKRNTRWTAGRMALQSSGAIIEKGLNIVNINLTSENNGTWSIASLVDLTASKDRVIVLFSLYSSSPLKTASHLLHCFATIWHESGVPHHCCLKSSSAFRH